MNKSPYIRPRAIGLLIAALAASACDAPEESGGRPQAGAGAPVLVKSAPVTRHAFIEHIEALGTAQANESVSLTAKLTDTVRTINFEDGDFAERGQVLVELTNEEQTALLDEAKANYDDAKRQLKRIEGLAEQGSVPISQADEARARHDGARARFDAIVARLDDRLIRAPFDGRLGFRLVSPGTLVTPGTVITTLDDVDPIKLDFTVPEVFLGALRRGLIVTARSSAYPDREFTGEVKNVDSRIDPVTRAAVVRAHIANEDRMLRPGMLLTVRLQRDAIEGLAVPEGAVQQVADAAFVYQVVDGRAVRRAVATGRREPGLVEITTGLSTGDLVVAEGLIKLRDGVAVRTAEGVAPGGD